MKTFESTELRAKLLFNPERISEYFFLEDLKIFREVLRKFVKANFDVFAFSLLSACLFPISITFC